MKVLSDRSAFLKHTLKEFRISNGRFLNGYRTRR